jgi:probable HAF family extracellular repeat protein
MKAKRCKHAARALALASVLSAAAGTATAQSALVDYGPILEPWGRIVDYFQKLQAGGCEFFDLNDTTRDVPIKAFFDKLTRTFLTERMQFAGSTEPSGCSTNASRDGRAFIGHRDTGLFTPFHAFLWTQTGDAIDLGTLDPANNASRSSDANDVSDGAAVIVGSSEIAGGAVRHAYRWTAAGGMVDLGAPGGAARSSRAFGVSASGDVVVGEGEFADANAISGFRSGAFRWTAAGGFQGLGALQPGFFSSATAVSADGTVVVGHGGVSIVLGNTETNGSRAFRWTQDGGLVPIGPLPGHRFADAAGLSDNGKIVVGTSSAGNLDRNGVGGLLRGTGSAFRWTEATGIQDLRQLLVDAGVDMTGVALVAVTGISPDGQWITGQATTPTTPVNETVVFMLQYCDDAIGGPCTNAAAAPFSVGASSNALTVAAGQSASTTLTVTPSAGFSDAIGFACAGLPRGAACTFSPATVTPAGAPVTTMLTISTDGSPVALWWPALPGAVALASFAALVPRRRRGDRRLYVVGFVFTALVVGSIAACGGGDDEIQGSNPPPGPTGTPAGVSTVTVSATSGTGATAATTTLPITLTVTR